MRREGGIQVNKDNKGGNTALLLAAWNGHFSVVELLLSREDTQVNQANHFGRTSCQAWASQGCGDIAAKGRYSNKLD